MRFSERAAWILVAAAAFVALPAAAGNMKKHPPQVGKLTRIVHKNVYIGTSKTPKTKSTPLYAGDTLRTGDPLGVAKFDLNVKRSNCTMLHATSISVAPSRDLSLRLAAGEVWCVTHGGAGRLTLTIGKHAKASTKDPVFGVVARGASATVKVKRGSVVVSGSAGGTKAVVVGRNQQTVVRPAGNPTQPAPTVLSKAQQQIAAELAATLPRLKDKQPPTMKLLVVPPERSPTRVASFHFTSSEGGQAKVTFACAVDGGAFHVCVPPVILFLSDGPHVFAVRAVDAAGNPGVPTTYDWTIHTVTRIVWESGRDGNPEIYAMNPDGSAQSRLTTTAAPEADPAWSPDRMKIAFHSERDGNSDVYVMNADGSGVQRRTMNAAVDRNPAWSPNGKKIVFESYRDATANTPSDRNIYVMNADGNAQRRLTTTPAEDFDPAWSPDGNEIAFASNRDGNYEIYVMNVDGTGQRRLTNTPASEFNPAWSPDENLIAFHSDRTGNYEIFVMNADGSNQRPLTRNAAQDHNPTWSPDGKQIAFQSDRDGDPEIYVMDADGNNQTRLTNSRGDDIVPDW